MPQVFITTCYGTPNQVAAGQGVILTVVVYNSWTGPQRLWCEVRDRDLTGKPIVAPRQTTTSIGAGESNSFNFAAVMPNKQWNLQAWAASTSETIPGFGGYADFTVYLSSAQDKPSARIDLAGSTFPTGSKASSAFTVAVKVVATVPAGVGENGKVPIWCVILNRANNTEVARAFPVSLANGASNTFAFNLTMPNIAAWQLRASVGAGANPESDGHDFDVARKTGALCAITNMWYPAAVPAGTQFDVEVEVQNVGDMAEQLYVTIDGIIDVKYTSGTVPPDGSFRTLRFVGIPMPNHDWVTQAIGYPGHFARAFTVTLVVDTETGESATWQFVSRASNVGTIAGSVKVPAGGAVPNASIKLEGPTSYDVSAGQDGLFSVQVNPGAYTLTATCSGYAPTGNPSYPNTATASVVAGQTATVALYLNQLQATGGAQGLVKSTDGKPIEAAKVETDSEMAITDKDGKYAFTLVPGAYTLTASADGFTKDDQHPNTATVTVKAGQITQVPTLYLKPSSILADYWWVIAAILIGVGGIVLATQGKGEPRPRRRATRRNP